MNRPLAAAVALLLAPAGAFAANLLTNGGFESGDTGFASDYTVVVYGSNSMLNADPPLPRYTIGNSATFVTVRSAPSCSALGIQAASASG